MTFTLRGPADTGAVNLRLIHPDGRVEDLFATPSRNTFRVQGGGGTYHAIVEPLGQGQLNFSFELPNGPEPIIEVPRVAELRAQARAPVMINLQAESLTLRPPDFSQPTAGTAISSQSSWLTTAQSERLPGVLREAATPKPITIGLSEDTQPGRMGGWRPYQGSPPSVTLAAGSLDVVLDRKDQRLSPPGGGARLRMSVAIQGTRVERFLLPLFRDGVRVRFAASPLTTADLSILVIPLDPGRRSLCQALGIGYLEEARKIVDDFLEDDPAPGGFDEEDPWTAVVLRLLAIRFPELSIPALDWRELAAGPAKWLSDAHVLAARQCLDQGRMLKGAAREAAARDAIKALARARQVGAPYFAQCNLLMGDMLTSLASGAPGDVNRHLAEIEARRWRRDITFRANAGVSFSWIMARKASDGGTQRARYTPPRGGLRAGYSRILFRGEVDLQQIRPRAPTRRRKLDALPAAAQSVPTGAPDVFPARLVTRLTRPLSTQRPPRDPLMGIHLSPARKAPSALGRAIRHEVDLHKGRFGGRPERKGFRLGVTFEKVRGRWVYMVLFITAPPGRTRPFVDKAEFFLHDTFEADHLEAVFQEDRAEVSVAAVGGFTVGAWIPGEDLELELDLAEVQDAPKAIKIY
ncbi:hypothetical protein M9M90_05035 [Phenylobacterium sp. LH3H17]|uniref:pYEATS domain-containing protein n=1 Tax=Phenylobacterium sp. LH3H17 TaxID=2903901 RepID=UPI0020C9B957|nr:pYEATS domain-containing protein [Phenylobacterium sp. LH3H17]UTP40550.1 hypothetical protein M9M90_05035 [Phenylobacterium sp. LH3H17]